MERHHDAQSELERYAAAEIKKRAQKAANARWQAMDYGDPARGEAGRKAWKTRRKRAREAKRKGKSSPDTKIISPA